MKAQKKILLLMFVSLLFVSSIPRSIQAIDIHSDSGASLIEGENEEHVLIFKYDTISFERIIAEEIRARVCRRTPTEFQITDVNDIVVTTNVFSYDGQDFAINHTEIINLNGVIYLIMAVNVIDENNLAFFVMVSEDNGLTWSDRNYITNTSISFASYNWFDATEFQGQIMIAFSSRFTSTINQTRRFFISSYPTLVPTSIEVTDTHFGDDFELFTYDNTMYLISTDPTGLEPFSTVRLTAIASTGGSFVGVTASIPAPENRADYFNPSVTYWEDGFFIAAHDLKLDVYDPTQNISFEEFFLWGAKVEDFGPTGDLVTPPSISYFPVVKNETDGYFRMNPSVSVYKGEIFVAFVVGEGRRFGGGWPEINFGFTKDGFIWTADYIGQFTFFLNPGIYFAIATVGIFVLVLPGYYIYDKIKKGK